MILVTRTTSSASQAALTPFFFQNSQAIDAEPRSEIAVVGAASQLHQTASLVADAIAGVDVAEVGAALVGLTAGKLLSGAKASRLVAGLGQEVGDA
ncbi:hypothetical protein QTI17_31155 [Variovorax sp. J31P179]|uniref:hypothetical protein n=1 Tax=Variovorax sp. J31P179 TaxID=3053508 RepID=UPI002574E227|nr:hypothetical protein [Variovorax sp. J31P179]MDM0085056.1 hypothetical protein [Variovorax sp. J31P179]